MGHWSFRSVLHKASTLLSGALTFGGLFGATNHQAQVGLVGVGLALGLVTNIQKAFFPEDVPLPPAAK